MALNQVDITRQDVKVALDKLTSRDVAALLWWHHNSSMFGHSLVELLDNQWNSKLIKDALADKQVTELRL